MLGSPAPTSVVRNHSARLRPAVQRIVRRVPLVGHLHTVADAHQKRAVDHQRRDHHHLQPEQLRRRVGRHVGGEQQHAADDDAGQAEDDNAVRVVDRVDLLACDRQTAARRFQRGAIGRNRRAAAADEAGDVHERDERAHHRRAAVERRPRRRRGVKSTRASSSHYNRRHLHRTEHGDCGKYVAGLCAAVAIWCPIEIAHAGVRLFAFAQPLREDLNSERRQRPSLFATTLPIHRCPNE